MRRILMISEKFPPFNTSGTGRPFYFAKYLPQFGYEPFVIASMALGSDERDDSLLEQLPAEVRIWRTPRLLSPAIQRRRKKAVARRGVGGEPAEASEGSEPRIRRSRSPLPYFGWWLHWEADWSALATVAGWVGAQFTPPDVVWVSAPHFRAIPIATRLSVLLRRPLVIDLRDPWTYGSLWHPKTDAIERAERRWAAHALSRASRIVLSSPLTLEQMHARFPKLEHSRLVTITNGFDDVPIEPLRDYPAGTCVFRYVGMLNSRRQPDPLIVAFARAAEDPEFRSAAVLEFVGNTGGHDGKVGLAPGCRVKFRGPVARGESLRLMRGSDFNVLLQTIREGQDVISGKAFDYLHARRPILAAVDPEGGDAWLVQETQTGYVVPWWDTGAVARELLACFRRFRAGPTSVPEADIARFSRRELTSQLASVLDEVVNEAQRERSRSLA